MRYRMHHNTIDERHSRSTGEGSCPNCGTEGDYTSISEGPEDDYYYYEVRCNHCGTVFEDWYRMYYVETEWATPEELEDDARTVWTGVESTTTATNQTNDTESTTDTNWSNFDSRTSEEQATEEQATEEQAAEEQNDYGTDACVITTAEEQFRRIRLEAVRQALFDD